MYLKNTICLPFIYFTSSSAIYLYFLLISALNPCGTDPCLFGCAPTVSSFTCGCPTGYHMLGQG